VILYIYTEGELYVVYSSHNAVYIASSPLQGILEVKRMANTGHLKLLIIAIMAMALLFSLGK
jgi:hypothetical protein